MREHKSSVETSVTRCSLTNGIPFVDMRNVSIQQCNIHRHKEDFRWNCLSACEFIDGFCCVFDSNCLSQLLRLKRICSHISDYEHQHSINVPIPDAICLHGGNILRSFAKVIMSFMS